MMLAGVICLLAAAAPPTPTRAPGPSGSLVIVDESHVVPIVHVVVAARTGSSSDPRGAEGLLNLAGEIARRGAAGRTRAQIDEALDALGATLDVVVDADSIRLVGSVLGRNLDDFLTLVADVVLRPDFKPAEFERTRREVLAQIDEMRNDDQSLAWRYFERRLYGDHPYGRAPDGTARTLERVTRAQAAERFRSTFVGPNLIFAAAGAITAADFQARLARAFKKLPAGPAPRAPEIRPPRPPEGWRVQIVDKPDRQQAQIVWGHVGVPAAHPDQLALTVAFAAFGGRGMNATLMDELRTRRGLAYGAYMGLAARRGPGPARGWTFTSAARAVTALKLVLRLYRQLARKGLEPERVRFFQRFLAGSHASDMDAPDRRLQARVSAEIEGLPADWIDTFAERVQALSPDAVDAAIKAHLRPDDLAIVLVATADDMTPRLVKSGVAPGAIDVVKYDAY